MELKLETPTVIYKESYLHGLQEFQNEGLEWAKAIDFAAAVENFEEFVNSQNSKMTDWTKETPVRATELWAIVNSQFVGRLSIRHELNASLRQFGGHIGYDTRPSFRQRGIASEMLRLSLPIAKSLGIMSALLTCNDDNLASIKVIEKNGGKLQETKPQYEGGPMKRYYWIKL